MRRTRSRILAALVTIALVVSGALAVAPAAYAADGDVEIIKTASTTTVTAGETFTYTLTVTCTTLGAGCTGASVVDEVPSYFTVVDVAVGDGMQGVVTQNGQHVEVDFTQQLPDGSQGILAGSTGTVTIQVQAADDLPQEIDGVPITNTAITDADTQTSGPLSDDAVVTPSVPLDLATDVTKSMSPGSAVANPGTPVTATIAASNDSNAPVDSMTIIDPGDPPGTPNPFINLPFTGIGSTTYPDGADSVEVLVWDGDSWEPYAIASAPDQPAVSTTVDDEDVLGVKLIFTDDDGSGIAMGATAGVEIGMEHGDEVVDLAGNVIVTNTAESVVEKGIQSATDTASATHQIVAANIDLVTSKTFTPSEVAAGDTSTATITAGNGSDFALSDLTVTEPALTGDPFENGFDDSMEFAGFAGSVTWPANATGATITYYYDDGTTEGPVSMANNALPPEPSGDNEDVARFAITFTGDIQPNAQTQIPFDVQTDPDQVGYPATITNIADITGTDPNGGKTTDQATDDLLVYEERLETITGKSIYPNEILDRPSEWVLVTLSSQIAPFPASTTDAETIVVQDPVSVPTPIDGTFWDTFNATEISQTAVPAGATLTINYWNGTAWVPLLDASGDPVEVEGPTVFSMDIPAGEQDLIQGLQFVYTADDGTSFPPGTTVEPHFSAEIRASERDPANESAPPVDIQNCGTSSASTSEIESTVTPDTTACDEVRIDPVDGAGTHALDKVITPQTVVSRSQSNVRAHLNWSTDGLSGIEQMVIQDEAAPPSTAGDDQADAAALAGSFYDAFDLISIDAITSAKDPYLQYDEIVAIEIWDGDSWEPVTGSACPCDGAFDGLTLNGPDRNAALGVRVVVEEDSGRADSTDTTAPPVGSGVTRSSGNDREVSLHFRLRDTRRSDGQPVMGYQDYNVADDDPAVGTVRNPASVTGTDFGQTVVIDTVDADTIAILDVPLNVDLTKTWSGSPFGIPPAGTPQNEYPTGRVDLTATNRTATKVDQLTISDPAPGEPSNPFLYFDLYDLRQITIPDGATTGVVTLSHDTSGDGISDLDVDYDVSTALGLTSMALADVVGVLVTHDGRIAEGATAGLQMDLQLRADVRGTSTPVATTDSPVSNHAQASVEDAGGGTAQNVPTADDTAVAQLAEFTIDVEAGKSFTPDTQTEGVDSAVVMTLSAQPTVDSAERVGGMGVEDTTATFWNAFSYVGIDPSFQLTTPINRVRMDVRTNDTFFATGSGVIAAGGAWSVGSLQTQADFLANPLPSGISAADVTGVRLFFVQDDGAGNFVQWENPIDPLQQIPIQVQRRAELRSGGEVPSDRADLDPAPGEQNAGEFTNTVTVATCASVSTVACGVLGDGTAIDTATDVMHYRHAESAVEITKTPTGLYLPGQSIPYTITVKNTGAWPIENPVFVDAPATDGRIMLNPEPDGALYTYSLSGDAPDPVTGLALPTGDDVIAPTIETGPEKYTWTFPAGTVLEVGQSYTITIDMVFDPGAPALIPISNSATVSGDRPLDVCNGDAGTFDDCGASAVVTPERAAAVRSQKLVRAQDAELGAFNSIASSSVDCSVPNAGALADPTSEGYYWYPCVPRSKPGGVVEWRFAIQNTGNVPLDRLVLVDLLPTPGDTGALSGAARGSQWTPTSIPSTLTAAQVPQGATVSFLVSTGAVCTDNLDEPGSPGDPLDACAPGDWVDIATVSDTSTITGVQSLIDMPDVAMQPGEIILIDGDTTTPAISETAGDDTIAWNSVASGAHTTEAQGSAAGGGQNMVPSEGTRVGAALATGSIDIRKSLSGDGTDYAPDTFTVVVSCISAGETIEPAATVEVTPGVTSRIDGLPWGAECTLTESAQGQISYTVTPDSVTVVRPDDADVAVITIDNVFDLAGLAVAKTVESVALDADGDPLEYGTFPISVACTFLGDPVYADGFTPGSDMAFELGDGEDIVLYGLPAGAECTVTETNVEFATGTTVASETADGTVDATEATSTTVILTPDSDNDEVTNSVAFVNTYGVGSLSVEKVLDPEDSPFAAGPYLAHVTCTLGDVTTWDGDITLSIDQAVHIDDVAAGSICTVEETDDGTATSTVIDPGSVEIPLGGEVTVTVTNVFAEGSVTVTKLFEGDTTWAAGSFEVTITCVDLSDGLLFVTIPGGSTRTLTAASTPAWTESYDRLPAGAYCVLFESDTGGAASNVIVDENNARVGFFQVQEDTELAFSLVNTFEVGSIEVTKNISGEGAELWGTDEFTVSLSCTAVIDGVETDLDIPGGAERTFTAGETVIYASLLPGSECTVSEVDDGGASGTTITPNDGVIVVSDGDEPALVTVDNTFDVGQLTVTKTLSGDAAQWAATGSFAVELSCTWNGGAIEIPGSAARSLSAANAFTTTYEDLPDGAECQLSETDDQGAANVTITPNDGVVIVDPDAEVSLTVDNRFDVGSIELSKAVESEALDAAGNPISYGPFEITVECSFLGAPTWGEGYSASPMAVEIAEGGMAEITGIPTGSECSVSETDADGAAGVTISGLTADGDITPGDESGVTFVVTSVDDGEATVSIDVVNTYDVGSIALTKNIAPIDSPFASGAYVVHVSCTLDGDATWDGDVVFDAPVDDPATVDDETDFAVTIGEIAAGSSCTFEETDLGYADEAVISPESVIVGSGETAVVTVTNTYLEGSVTVAKVLDGDTYWAPDSFEVALTCIDPDDSDRVIDIPGGAERTLDEANSFATTYERLPVGAECEVIETDDGHASSHELLDENGDPIASWTVGEDDSREFTLVNTFVTDEIEVTKVASGEGAELWGTDTFTVHLDCTWNGESIEIPGGADRELQITDDPTTSVVVYDELPPGAECEVTEPDAGGASSHSITPEDGVIVVGDGDQPVAVTVDNTFDVGQIVVNKEISGEGVDWVNGENDIVAEFEVTLSCTWNGGEIVVPDGAVRVLSSATTLSTTYANLPDGAECVLEETDAANASEVTLTPADGVVTVEPGASVSIDVDNRYDVGVIDVRKFFVGDGSDFGSQTTFWVNLSCTWEIQGETVDIDVPGTAYRPLNESNEYRTSYTGLPNGAECTLTETDTGGATAVFIGPTGEMSRCVRTRPSTSLSSTCSSRVTSSSRRMLWDQVLSTSAKVRSPCTSGAL